MNHTKSHVRRRIVPRTPLLCKATVLLVEGYKKVREALAWYLSAKGYHVLLAEDLAQAEAIAHHERQDKIDLLLANLDIPTPRLAELTPWFTNAHPDGKRMLMAAMLPARRAVDSAQSKAQPFILSNLAASILETLAENGLRASTLDN
jgi:DNA-binding NtrC family response regulator